MEYNMIFTLGYDLMHDILDEHNLPCDIAFEVCKIVYNNFIESKEYKYDLSEYDALDCYIYNNEEQIKILIKEYGKTWS